MSEDIAKTISVAWEQRDVHIVLPLPTARAVWRRAAQWDVEEGGRFDARPSCILLWSSSCIGDHDHPEPRPQAPRPRGRRRGERSPHPGAPRE